MTQKGFSFVLILLTIFLGIAFLLAIYLYFKNDLSLELLFKRERTNQKQTTDQSIKSTIDNWKHYENTEYGFTLKYPPNLQQYELKEFEVEGEYHIAFKLPDNQEGPNFYVTVYKNWGPEKTYKWQRLGWQSFLDDERDITVDGYKGKMLVVKDFVPDKDATKSDHKWDAAAIISNDATYIFRGVLTNTKHPEYAIFEEVISTIKFTKSGINKFEVMPDTKEWGTYIHPKVGYTVKYPKGWTVEDLPVYEGSTHISYTTFEDLVSYDYKFGIEILPLTEYQNFITSDESGTCTNPELKNISFRSGRILEYKSCKDFRNYFLLQYPDHRMLVVVMTEKGNPDDTMIDAFTSTFTFN